MHQSSYDTEIEAIYQRVRVSSFRTVRQSPRFWTRKFGHAVWIISMLELALKTSHLPDLSQLCGGFDFDQEIRKRQRLHAKPGVRRGNRIAIECG